MDTSSLSSLSLFLLCLFPTSALVTCLKMSLCKRSQCACWWKHITLASSSMTKGIVKGWGDERTARSGSVCWFLTCEAWLTIIWTSILLEVCLPVFVCITDCVTLVRCLRVWAINLFPWSGSPRPAERGRKQRSCQPHVWVCAGVCCCSSSSGVPTGAAHSLRNITSTSEGQTRFLFHIHEDRPHGYGVDWLSEQPKCFNYEKNYKNFRGLHISYLVGLEALILF